VAEFDIFVDFIPTWDYNKSCIILPFYHNEERIMGYLSISQTAEKWGISQRRIRILCAEGRIPGAFKMGAYWSIPDDAEKPRDERIKSGRYIKTIEK
jgi:hypothetical protein